MTAFGYKVLILNEVSLEIARRNASFVPKGMTMPKDWHSYIYKSSA